jgi:hypothetical protein
LSKYCNEDECKRKHWLFRVQPENQRICCSQIDKAQSGFLVSSHVDRGAKEVLDFMLKGNKKGPHFWRPFEYLSDWYLINQQD